MIELFYRIMYRHHTINYKADSGRKYIIEYHRPPFWAYEKRSLKLFLKEKINVWHGQVWEVFPRGGKCGFGTTCISSMFPRKQMKKFLFREVKYLESIFNNKDMR